jgi:hypothetical protein
MNMTVAVVKIIPQGRKIRPVFSYGAIFFEIIDQQGKFLLYRPWGLCDCLIGLFADPDDIVHSFTFTPEYYQK